MSLSIMMKRLLLIIAVDGNSVCDARFVCDCCEAVIPHLLVGSRPNNIEGKNVRPSVRPSVHKKFLQFE